MLTREQKKQIIEDLTDKIKRQKILVFTDFRGLKVGELQKLRRELKGTDGEYKIAKKTLIKLALEKAKKEVDISKFDASLSLVFGYSEPVGPAKIVSGFKKEHDKLKILGGLMDDNFLTVEDIRELAAIPSRNELIAKLIGSIQAPISGFVNVLEGNIRNLIGVLSAISNK